MTENTKPYDQAFKFLAEQDAHSLLVLLGFLKPGDKAEIEPLPRELSVSTLLPDQPYKVVKDGKAEIVHIEAQALYELPIPKRMAEYGARLWMKQGLPVRSYVLLLTPRGLPQKVPLRGRIRAGDIEISVRYRLICLWKISARRILRLGRESLLPFVPLMHGGQSELEDGAAQLRRVEDERQRRDMALHFVMLGGLRYNQADLLELIGRRTMIPLEQLKESSFYQMILKEGREEGFEEGREEGFEEGREEGFEEGREKGVEEVLGRIVSRRFPNLDVSARIEQIHDVERLKTLCEEVFDLPTAEALMNRLDELSSNN